MKVFISWSGTRSHAIALALRNWLPYIFTDMQVFVSSEDVRKGKRWLPEISKELSTTNFGIVCLTRDNLESPWILFESGALSKLKSAHVCTLLFGDIRNVDIEGPLSNFQHTAFNKADFLKLIQSINTTLGKARLEEQRLKTMFEKWWSDLEKAVSGAAKESAISAKPKRSGEELLVEVLEIVREIARITKSSAEADDYQKLRKLLSIPVKDLELSGRATAILQNAGIFTVGRLAQKTEVEMLKYRGLGAATFKELRRKLAELGLAFGMWFEDGLLIT